VYLVEFTKILLPGLLLMLLSVVPLALGTLTALIHLRAGRKGQYIRNLLGAIVAGAITLLLLTGSLFGDDLSGSSTAILIFLFVPIYSAGAWLIGYLTGVALNRVIRRTSGDAEFNPPISNWVRNLVWIPVLMFTILVFGVMRYSIQNNDLAVAERASRPETLHYIFDKVEAGNADAFDVPLFLAQNPNTPIDILKKLSKSKYPQIRIFVANNPNTPNSVVVSLKDDPVDYVRKEAREKIGDTAQPMH
jgi:hypothetical protein